MEQEKIDVMLERMKNATYRSSLIFALAEYAEEKLRKGEILDRNSLESWAAKPSRKKAYSLAIERFLTELNGGH
ncbi:hypothetical protein HYE54_05160 [Aggregatibacter actinomycetemcomitans]|uniref:hypothetical protein n=1 Tax=Aggregatibacter actinomycetemcomitans TaxID=714 RepID=UPI00197CA09B|nr:hypothetical protein [Aggregatibacter actinomycetemcomitans]MBN6068165.1 hypothetical protein [Aggregatibacter actinomycetemcomitans]MBN6086041.1 hypothetical protein [Aggregatibacter actinomycetemcomitans]